mmetsp:Transcript_34997/g.51292  ORF Transcript_34997/g.51292 Transcript_34997/m.51292 type:complete len:690 (+) Transcript_34997:131-2200(+)
MPNISSPKPLNIGIFGGSFNPIHLGHVLLAVATSQTRNLDKVILVPVYKHAIKKDLLPFKDRVAMCKLAVSSFSKGGGNGGIVEVSTIEQEVKQSNGAMIRHLKAQYNNHHSCQKCNFYWICGDDIFTWIESPKGIETMKEVSGIIIQRRLHKTSSTEETFYKCPKPTDLKIQSIQQKLPHLTFDFIHGELPHFSSTLVRRAPGHWRSFLPQSVAIYLDERPILLQQLNKNLIMDAKREEEEEEKKEEETTQELTAADGSNACIHTNTQYRPRVDDDNVQSNDCDNNNVPSTASTASVAQTTTPNPLDLAISTVMRGLEVVHALQWERGQTALSLSSLSTPKNDDSNDLNGKNDVGNDLKHVRSVTDKALLHAVTLPESLHDQNQDNKEDIVPIILQSSHLLETTSLAYELRHTQTVWLQRDRAIVDTFRTKNYNISQKLKGAEGWTQRYILVEKFNPRIDVLVSCVIRSFREILDSNSAKEENKDGNSDSLISSRSATSSSIDMFSQWCKGKEALGRLRAFVCAGGRHAPSIVRSSIDIRKKIGQIIATKERRLERVLTLSSSTTKTTPATAMTAEMMIGPMIEIAATTTQLAATIEALHHMLERITAWEWSLMGCFASSTPLNLVHKLLREQSLSYSALRRSNNKYGDDNDETDEFDVQLFFETTSSAIDLMLTVVKALAAFGCARV